MFINYVKKIYIMNRKFRNVIVGTNKFIKYIAHFHKIDCASKKKSETSGVSCFLS